jgi:hypothetical protein
MVCKAKMKLFFSKTLNDIHSYFLISINEIGTFAVGWQIDTCGLNILYFRKGCFRLEIKKIEHFYLI